MSFWEYTLFAFSSLFFIIDPIGIVPTFLATTNGAAKEQRIRIAKFACILAGSILLLFAYCGHFIFHYLGISIAAFQMGGSIILLLVALEMLKSGESELKTKVSDDSAVTPIALPLLAGPGAISSVILLNNKASGLPQKLMLGLNIGLIMLISFGFLYGASKGTQFLSERNQKVLTKIMGVLLAAIAMQFLINAVKDIKQLL
jgi:multiple antibiotic resistance protein